MFTEKDIEQLESLAISQERVEGQIERFKNGFPILTISRAAQVGDGILQIENEQLEWLADYYQKIENLKVVKFVPASGAATRMMKELFEYADSGVDSKAVDSLFENISKFAFTPELQENGVNIEDKKELINSILYAPLNYGKYPKGVIKFHTSESGARTPIDEHLVEGALYGVSSVDGGVYIHFTVSPEHMDLFKGRIESVISTLEAKFGVKYHVSYSTQKKSTDTIAVDIENNPIRKSDGSMLFRPAGHGALIENLNDIDADVIFIKTIDNVQPDRTKGEGITYKKALAALAVKYKRMAESYIKAINNGIGNPEEIVSFVESTLGCRLGESTSFEQLRALLDRPLRVCGMVRNEGEPGGGPFWVVNPEDGSESLQILESAQIPADKRDQLMGRATHFNPVDLVCAVSNQDGSKFNLLEYVDDNCGFISEKSFEGKPLKAMELPGLWNGAMANWNTIFVEVPMVTFSPVKTIVDLLRPEHQ